jgi:dGTPase
LEVAQIAEGIAERLNFCSSDLKEAPIRSRVCVTAALLHDIGHPPFGHNGERALDDAMRLHGGFEGNAQTIRIISKLEKKVVNESGVSFGLDLTYRGIASVLKYDKKIPRSRRAEKGLVKGYYGTEEELVKSVKSALVGDPDFKYGEFKTIECSIMDLADDIAYSTFDLEDSLKAGFITPGDVLTADNKLLEQVAAKVSKELKSPCEAKDVARVFKELFEFPPAAQKLTGLEAFVEGFEAYRNLGQRSDLRTTLSSQLVRDAIDAVQFHYNKECPLLSTVSLKPDVAMRVEVLKQYTFLSTIYSSRVKLPEYRGYEVVKRIFEALAGPKGYLLMPEDTRLQYEAADEDFDTQMRIVCDFVAGMTDRYAMEFYGRLHSDTSQSMFKPV